MQPVPFLSTLQSITKLHCGMCPLNYVLKYLLYSWGLRWLTVAVDNMDLSFVINVSDFFCISYWYSTRSAWLRGLKPSSYCGQAWITPSLPEYNVLGLWASGFLCQLCQMTFVMKLSKSEEKPKVVSWWQLYHIAVFVMKQRKGIEISVP